MAGPMDPTMVEGPQPMSPVDMGEPPEMTLPGEKVVEREKPEVSDRRKHLVSALNDMVVQAKKTWETVFTQMERDQRFCAGKQWPEETKAGAYNDATNDRYVANITLRHVQQRVSALYAKNPKIVARKRQQLLSTVWDGTMQSLMQAQQQMQSAQAFQQYSEHVQGTGQPPVDPATMAPAAPPPPPDMMAVQQAQMVMQDAQQVKQATDMLNRIARTLELLYEYEIDTQQQPFKSMMKLVIRRGVTTGVGWVRVGFQRVMGRSPDYDSRLADIETRLASIERISADIADGEIDENSPEVEQLKLMLNDMQDEAESVLREGLVFSYPKSTAIIPDPRCVSLKEFLGCDWVAEEYILTPNQIQETYGVDIGTAFKAYDRLDSNSDYESARAKWDRVDTGKDLETISDGDADSALVWEIYNKRENLVYVVCDGHEDFLREPAAPEFYTERFWPWFAVTFNDCDGQVYPPSDVQLVRSMQLELNRSRQGLREHRFANRPKLAYADGLLSEEDLEALRNHPVNAVIAISGLQPGQSIEQVLMPLKGSPLDPNLYEVNPVFQDFLRVSGDQEANLGGTSDATATETNVAQASRQTSIGSAIDDLDETLTQIAKAAGQILVLNVSEETVKSIVGPGAVWPTLTKSDVAKQLYLEIEAGSSGRPDQQLEVQNFQQLAPVLMQIPGITPMFLAKEAIKRLDDKLDVEAAVMEGAPSIMAMNSAKPAGPPGSGPEGGPEAQGPNGGNNAQKPPSPDSKSPGPKSPANGPVSPGM